MNRFRRTTGGWRKLGDLYFCVYGEHADIHYKRMGNHIWLFDKPAVSIRHTNQWKIVSYPGEFKKLCDMPSGNQLSKKKWFKFLLKDRL